MRSAIRADFAMFCAATNPSCAFSAERARKTTSQPPAANTSPLPAPIVPLAPRTTTFLISIIASRTPRIGDVGLKRALVARFAPRLKGDGEGGTVRRTIPGRSPSARLFGELVQVG